MLSEETELVFDSEIDLKDTIESGQTFLWTRKDGELFDELDNPVYQTCRRLDTDLAAIEVEQTGRRKVSVRSNVSSGYKVVSNVLGKDLYNITDIQDDIIKKDSADGIMEEAIDRSKGLRVVNEPLFPTLISFICSTQMRVERIHDMINSLKRTYGDSVQISDETEIYAFPTPEQLSKATEGELKDLKLGYRARYVVDTVDMFASESDHSLPKSTEDARTHLKNYMGVGTKVADCILLYSGGYYDVVPVDTWIESAVGEYYENLYSDSNEKIARDFESFFGEYAGFAQAYLFHYARS